MKIGTPPEGAVQLRSLESRRFATTDEKALMGAATECLQDLGFTITESSADAGLLVGQKHRDATETGQVVGAILVGILLGANAAQWDRDQVIVVTLATTPIQNSKQTEARVTFERLITNNKEQTRSEMINEPGIYQQFFERLSKAVFLEAQTI